LFKCSDIIGFEQRSNEPFCWYFTLWDSWKNTENVFDSRRRREKLPVQLRVSLKPVNNDKWSLIRPLQPTNESRLCFQGGGSLLKIRKTKLSIQVKKNVNSLKPERRNLRMEEPENSCSLFNVLEAFSSFFMTS